MDNSPQPLSVLSLCTGYGGIERGLELAGVRHRVITHVEIEAFAIANLVNKMEAGELDAAPVWSHLKTLPVDCFRDRVAILTGGYPCQPFSAAGKRAGADDPRHLWPYIYDIIRAVRPVQCFFENVEGHISLGLREVIEDLESLGYAATWGVFSAAEVGAPHQRKRVFILAHSRSKQDRSVRGTYEFRRNSLARDAETAQQKNWETSSNGTRGRSAGVDDSNGVRLQTPWPEQQTTRAVRASELAHSTSKISQGGQRAQSEGRGNGFAGSSEDVADTTGIGTQGHRSGGQQEPHAHGQETLFVCEGERPGPTDSDALANLGRGFDGVASWLDGSWELGIPRVTTDSHNRVDRIRLLGNGVVPQTAAKAWLVLNEQIASE